MARKLTDFPVHASIAVSDLGRARTWYEEKLGLVPDEEDEGGAWFRFAGGSWLHVYQTGSAGTAQNTVAGITVENIEDLMAHLRSNGVEFEEYDFPGLKTENGIATFGSAKAAWFKDPDGNTIELSETP